MQNALEISGVTKAYGNHTAVDDLNLVVPTGSVMGFIGPNGSGKTTTMRMVLRILYPDKGEIRILGNDHSQLADDRVGYLPEERGLYKKMKVRDVLEYYSQLKGVRNCRPLVADWLRRFELDKWSNKRVDALSKGMSQKVQFIAAVVSRPDLLILDEPFSGLDPVNHEVLKDAILDLRQQGVTVILSTHNMDVAERMCDSICMIFRGKKVLDGTLSEIQSKYGDDTIRIRLSTNTVSVADVPGVIRVNDCGSFHELRIDRSCEPQRLLRDVMSRSGVELFEITKPSLHDIFVRIAGPDADNGEHPHA